MEHLSPTRKFLVVSRIILSVIFLIAVFQTIFSSRGALEILVNLSMLFYLILLVVLTYQEISNKNEPVFIRRLTGVFSVIVGSSLGYVIIKFGNNSFVWLGILLCIWIVIVGLCDLFAE